MSRERQQQTITNNGLLSAAEDLRVRGLVAHPQKLCTAIPKSHSALFNSVHGNYHGQSIECNQIVLYDMKLHKGARRCQKHRPRRGLEDAKMVENDDESLKLSNQLCFAIYSAAHTFNRAYKPILEPLGLTYPQYLALLVLWEQDGLTVKEIGQRLYLDSGTLTPVLKRLQASGYVQRSRDMSDERQVRVTLTQRGRETRTQALAGQRELVCALGWSEEQIRALKGELDQLRAALRSDAQNADDDMSREDAPTLTTPLENQPRKGKRTRQA